MLCAGTDATRDVPADRWNIQTFYDPDAAKPGKTITAHGGFLDQVDQFDARFFGISPREAECLDPQQRLLLETSWEAFEDAGIAPERLAGSHTGVFIGAFTLDYKILQMSTSNHALIDAHTATGSMMTMVSNRLSYIYDLRGPSMSIDTACSSSLVAVHLACESLRRDECSLALAGGVNVITTPEYTIAESKGGFLSPDGRCKTFDADANGYARGEGAGIVVLKLLALAIADGDPIYAVIRGSAVNQDGHTNGITVPNGEAQAALLREAYARAGVTPSQIQYVEAHGTGTPVGDPIEAKALGNVLSVGRSAADRCVIGSVKTNIGHLEAAAGIAGLIKTVLCLKHRAIPQHLHLRTPNPNIPFEQLHLRIPQSLEPWPEHEGVALASVNSFGFGGTNAHVVLQAAPEIAPTPNDLTDSASVSGQAYLMPLTAHSSAALEAVARTYQDMLSDPTTSAVALDDLGYTASLRRSQHDHRLAIVGDTPAALADQLAAFLAGETRTGLSTGRVLPQQHARLVFVFSGMGPQWWAMGRQLLEQEPVFRAAVERCDALLQQYTEWSLLEEMLADETASRMHETQIAQPANFALQVALADLWKSWGIVPDAIVGHSAGEAAAFYAAGVLSLEAAVRVIYQRSRLQHRTTGQGKLVAVGVSLAEAQRLVAGHADRVSIAAINSPSAVTLGGDPDALDAIVAPLQAQQIFCRYLRVEVPYHSHYMDPLRDELLAALDDLDPQPATIPLYSTVTGAIADGRELDATYWWNNIRHSVYFAAAVESIVADGYDTFLELSPHPVLAGPISECLIHLNRSGTVLPSIRRNEAERSIMLGSLGTLYTLGRPIQWQTLYGSTGRLIKLPAYPWQRERYWSESEESRDLRLGRQDHPLLGRPLQVPQPTWELEINRRCLSYLDDHRIQGATVYPGAAYIEMGLAAAGQIFGAGSYAVEELAFRKALFLPDHTSPKLQLSLNPDTAAFAIYSRTQAASPWTLHATGELRQRQESSRARRLDLHDLRSRCREESAGPECYAHFSRQGFEYGPCFQGIARLWRGDSEALAQLQIATADAAEDQNYHLHPTVLDACFQVLIAINPGDGQATGVYLPVGIDRVRVHRRPTGQLWSYARLVEQTAERLSGDILLLDEHGSVLVEILGFRAQSLQTAQSSLAIEKLDSMFYELAWKAQPHEPQSKQPRPTEEAGSWLIFSDGYVGEALTTLLHEQGETCVTLTAGATYRVVEPGRAYQLSPDHIEDLEQVLEELRTTSAALRGVVHLWSLRATPLAELTVDALEADQKLGCLSVMRAVQLLVQADISTRLWLVTRGAQPVSSADQNLALAQTPLWGLGRVIGYQEHVGLWGGAIDLDPAAPADEARQLLDELLSADGEDQIAFRAGERYIARLVQSTNLTAPLPPSFRTDGSYLITGAFGALGQLVARWMVAQGARRLILMGRTKLPPRADWHLVEQDSPIRARIDAIRELEALGASIQIAPIDVADQAQLTSFIAQYRREGWPPIRGVVHSAGTVHDQLLLQMEPETFTKVLRPKLLGGWALHQALHDQPLDFFVLFSSVASLVVSTGQANYAAGNAFLDALAHYRRAQGLPALSINWGPWAVGMVSQLNLIEHYARRGMEAIQPEVGMQALGRLLGQNIAEATVIAAKWPVVLEYYPQYPPLFAYLGLQADADAEAQDAAEETLLQRLAHAGPEERSALVLGQLQDLAARVLRLERARLDVQEPLSALGMNSMMAIELKNRIDLSLGVTISVVELLQGFSLAQIAARLLPQIEQLTPEFVAADGPITTEEVQQLAEQLGDTTLAELLGELDSLSEAEVEALLMEQIA